MLNILFPKYCPGCGSVLDQPKILLCISCRNALPLTQYHLHNNPRIVDKFYGLLPLERGTALLHYHKKGLAQRLIHALKYRGEKAIGQWLGQWLGTELKSIDDYRHINAVVPVPMYPKKLRQRGYNQAAIFGKALAKALDIPMIETLLIQTQMRHTQAKQGRWERWAKKNAFALNPDYEKLILQAFLKHKHSNFSQRKNHHPAMVTVPKITQSTLSGIELILVDDVITTGATIEACGRILTHELGAALSCASIAIA